jgi:hypothetical protein
MNMQTTERNACLEAFNQLQGELKIDSQNDKKTSEDCPYWVFERGYRAAVQELMDIADTGVQVKKFVSPKLQSLAERLICATDCV